MNRPVGFAHGGRDMTLTRVAAKPASRMAHAGAPLLRAVALLSVAATALAFAGCNGSASRSYKGTFTMFTLPSPMEVANAITAGPDGNLWFTQGGHTDSGPDTYFERMTPAGKVTGTFTVPQDLDVADGLLTAPDGNVWFYSAGSIGRITPDGKITGFDPPHGGAWGLAVGPDGNLWFADNFSNYFGRFS